ncbi:MAG: response regulator transcription factor [Burkholderiaceae bacterium]
MKRMPENQSSAPVIHIVDDEESLRTALSRLLRAHGYRVVLYESAEQFRGNAHLHEPGCILLDFNMPGMNGLQLQEQLAQDQCELPIIFLTGNGHDGIRELAVNGGAHDFLYKPVVKEELINAIERVLADTAKPAKDDSRFSRSGP